MKRVAVSLAFVFSLCTLALAQTERPGVMLGAFIPATDNYRETILAFDQNTGRVHTHILIFCSFDYNFDQYPYLLEQVRDAGKTPVICWQPGVQGAADPSFSNASFLRGEHDAQIINMARQCREFSDTIYMRWAHEMNISTAPAWPGHSWNNHNPQEFIDMYRYVHNKFNEVGATNVRWVWSVNYESAGGEGHDTYSNYNNLYPGDDYVDMVGLSGLNYGNQWVGGPSHAVTSQWLYIPVLRNLMAGTYNRASGAYGLRALANLAKGKPQGVFEFGTVDSSLVEQGSGPAYVIPKEDWIRQSYAAFKDQEEFGYVRLLMWYNDIATTDGALSDFRVAKNPGRSEPPVPESWTQAYREAISDPFFLDTPLTLEKMTPRGYFSAASLPVPASYPQHEFWLSVYPGGEMRRGSTLAAAMFLHPPNNMSNQRCDAYIVAQIPSGELFAFIPPARWVQVKGKVPAAVKGFTVKWESRIMVFAARFEGLPIGTYRFYSILVPPGADPRNGGPDLKVATFTLTP